MPAALPYIKQQLEMPYRLPCQRLPVPSFELMAFPAAVL
jgi:hypothetical protein